ncbi:MAG: CinA family nicotinamide mononucleotide deamidase-related protein [Kiritimatiellae bacterium]|nr:CinA family nicotinamide mononucleotide deamidase-related protein [Kiritimatiellia bacterium]
MKATVELVSTGAELLSGRTLNTHTQTLARYLAELGLELSRETSAPDDRIAIRDAVRDALARASVVIVTGGLGPTSDDVTRDAVAEVVGAEIVLHTATREAIRQRYERTNRIWSEKVSRHALVLSSADVLENRAGLAPGEAIQWQGRRLFLLPGPPNEFEAVLQDHVMPRLKAVADVLPLQRVFQVAGLGESDIVRLLPEEEFPGPDVSVAYCASPGLVEIRLSALPSAAAVHARAVALVRERLGEWVFAEQRVDLETVVVEALRAAGKTVALAESCTGGLLGHRLTNVPGSSEVFLGGIVAYANASKIRDLGVPADLLEREGAVSPEVALAMAKGVRARFGSDIGVGVTGIAGPSGGTPQKPVGLVYLSVADEAGAKVEELRMGGPRATIKQTTSQRALDMVRRRVAAVH